MARWDEPTFQGMAGKVGSLHLAGQASYPVAASVQPFAVLPLYGMATVQVPGGTQVHHVNALDPGTTGDYRRVDRGGDYGRVIPAGRG